ncbi:MAG: hypothetical protein IIT65_11645 [Lachnospiraceae bacterium]|nr:hypothetical protein [Lachnospiraceae bacterium]
MKLMINESNFSKREVNNQVKDYIERFCDNVELAFTDNPEKFGIEDESEEYYIFANAIRKQLSPMLKLIGKSISYDRNMKMPRRLSGKVKEYLSGKLYDAMELSVYALDRYGLEPDTDKYDYFCSQLNKYIKSMLRYIER